MGIFRRKEFYDSRSLSYPPGIIIFLTPGSTVEDYVRFKLSKGLRGVEKARVQAFFKRQIVFGEESNETAKKDLIFLLKGLIRCPV